MLTALFVVLSIFLSVVSAQNFGGNSGFLGDGLTITALAICSLFILLFFVQIIHCFVVWMLTTGHRWPYVALFFGVLCSLVAAATNVAFMTVTNMANMFPTASDLIGLSAVNQFFANWAAITLYVSLMAFLFDRRRAIRSASGGKIAARENGVLTAIHFSLILLLLVFSVASPAVNVDGQIHRLIRLDITRSEYRKRIDTSVKLNYAFNAFLCLTSFSFLVSTYSLYKSARSSGVRDPITSILLYVINPVYAMLNLCGSFIFVIVFSASGIPLQDNKSYRHASIAATCLIQLFYFATAAGLLFLAARRSNWDVQSADGTSTEMLPQGQVQQLQAYYVQRPYAAQSYTQSYTHGSRDTFQRPDPSPVPPPGYPSQPSSPLSAISQDIKFP